MNKYNKKIHLSIFLVFICALIVCYSSYLTFARYAGLSSGGASVDIAMWNIKINGVTVSTSSNITPAEFTSPITWETNPYVHLGQIAPGSRGKSYIKIESTNTEVAFDYYIKATIPSTLDNDNIVFGNLTAGVCDTSGAATLPSTETDCNTAGGSWSDGICFAPVNYTQTWCNAIYGTNKWTSLTLTDGTGNYAGYKKGTMLLPNTSPMTSANTIYAYLPLEWIDYNTDPENESDTSTGMIDSSATITFDVIVEQKIE